jgi:hypothetical protein
MKKRGNGHSAAWRGSRRHHVCERRRRPEKEVGVPTLEAGICNAGLTLFLHVLLARWLQLACDNTPTAKLVGQVLGSDPMTVAKLRGARDRKRKSQE